MASTWKESRSKRVPQARSSPWQAFLTRSYLWLLVLGLLWSVLNLRKHSGAAGLIGGASLLVLICAIPYTGWLAGYFVSARMLWRAPWFFPAGCVATLLVINSVNFIARRFPTRDVARGFGEHAALGFLVLICLVLLGYFAPGIYLERAHEVSNADAYRNNLEKLSLLGNYLEVAIRQPSLVASPRPLMDLLPGLSSKSKGIAYNQTGLFTPHPVPSNEIDQLFAPAAEVSLRQRLDVLRFYKIRYILTQSPELLRLYTSTPSILRLQRVSGYWLLEFQVANP